MMSQNSFCKQQHSCNYNFYHYTDIFNLRVSSSSKILPIIVLTSTIALFIAGINPIIYVTAILGITLPPYSAFQEKKITDCRAMRQTNESMTREMENLQYNNDRLKAENEKLEGSVER